MPAEIPQGELSRTRSHDPDQSYPDVVEIRLVWKVRGKEQIRAHQIGADEFFGRGQFGAPIPAEALVQAIERMRRQGAPTARKRK